MGFKYNPLIPTSGRERLNIGIKQQTKFLFQLLLGFPVRLQGSEGEEQGPAGARKE